MKYCPNCKEELIRKETRHDYLSTQRSFVYVEMRCDEWNCPARKQTGFPFAMHYQKFGDQETDIIYFNFSFLVEDRWYILCHNNSKKGVVWSLYHVAETRRRGQTHGTCYNLADIPFTQIDPETADEGAMELFERVMKLKAFL